MSHCALSPCHRLKSQLIYGYYCESRSTPFSSDSGRANTWSISNLLSGHAWMWELDYKGSWELKNWCFWTVVLEKSLESPLDCKEIQPVHPKRDHSWVFIGRTDVEAETPILWPLMGRTDSFEKALMLGKIEGRRKRGWQRMRWLNVITASMDMRLGELRDLMVDWCDVVHGVTKSRTWLSNWTEVKQVKEIVPEQNKFKSDLIRTNIKLFFDS